jgi:hypothetical protein
VGINIAFLVIMRLNTVRNAKIIKVRRETGVGVYR